MRTTELLCSGWEFAKCAFGTEYENAKSFAPVDIPHDWLIYNTNDLYETSTGWYRKTLVIPDDSRRTSIRFEGVYMDSKIYVNGALAGEWKYGYTTFEFDITKLLKSGENLITVRVDHREPNTRWYSGAGIFRNVYLERFEQTHILADGVYISADIDGGVCVTTECARPEGDSVGGLSIRTEICKKGERSVLASITSLCCACDKSVLPGEITAEGFSYSVNTQKLNVNSPMLWDVDSPQLYTCTVTLLKDGCELDSVRSDLGFKKAEFTADKGFFLNGRHLKIHGVCEHHDLGALGAAFNKAAMRRKLAALKEMGVNALRTSHNPPAVGVLELCDEMGILLLDEAFDMWERSKTEYDYARFFDEWVNRDVCSWVRRDRNHVCLIGWSIGNEIYDTHAGDRGQEVTSLLAALVRKHDCRTNGVITIGSNFMQWENARKCADILKIAGYNYAERLYERDHKEHPDWAIYGSETSSVTQSRGIYHFPLEERILCDDDEQCSSLGNTSPAWAAKNTYACIIPDRDTQFCAGQFVWTGCDYIGEPTPYSTKNSYFGQIDTAGFPKDSFYIFKAEWTDYKTAPFVHIFPYWDFSEGQEIDVRAVSNAPVIRLYFNGRQIAEKQIDHAHGTELSLDTKLNYTKGELTAVAYDENGREIARDRQASFSDAVKLLAKADKTVMNADGEDMIFIEISALDENGEAVANANNRVFVSVTGEGRLVGLDNGDSTDYEQYKTDNRRMFSGRLLAMIASTKQSGKIKVELSSVGLEGCTLLLTAEDTKVRDGISAQTTNARYESDFERFGSEVPIRKIEIVSSSLEFDKENDVREFKMIALPADNTYKDSIEYRLTTALGIDTNLAEIVSKSSESVTVKCKGDGEFYLRALTKNGKDKYSILSAVKLSAGGLGAASFDPYSFIFGGLYTKKSGGAGNGIERGASFSEDFGYISFENTDFGKLGSDTVTTQIYMNRTTPVTILFYDGTPDNGEKIGEFEYCVPSKWLTYNSPISFKLDKKLNGIHTFTIAAKDGFEVAGFEFERPDKERMTIPAVSCENIYGDSFTIEKDSINHIGNNVVVDLGEFDFTGKKPARVCITGASSLDVNSIHLCFDNGDDTRILCEFEKAESFTERVFDINGIDGKGKVSLTFLPGCDFNLKSIRFE